MINSTGRANLRYKVAIVVSLNAFIWLLYCRCIFL